MMAVNHASFIAGAPPHMAVSAAQCYRPAMSTPTRSAASEAMDRHAEGDARAFSELYDALAPRLHAYLRRQLRSVASVEDVLQHTFMQLHVHRGKFNRGARVEPWAYAIARAAAIDLQRRDAVRRSDELDAERTEGSDASADALLGAEQLSEAVQVELTSLSPKLREAFLLVRIEGLSHAEAAQVVGIEETAMKLRAHRATHWLRDKLARFGRAEGAK